MLGEATAELRSLFLGHGEGVWSFDEALPEKLDELDPLRRAQLSDSLG